MSRTAIKGTINVLEACRKRITYIFDNYDNIQLSFSGGKDSTALYYLLSEEAIKRNRKFYLFFLDQEAEYQGTIDLVDYMMQQKHIIPRWFQVPIFMTNAVSSSQMFLWAWGLGQKWVRDKNPIAIHSINKKYPKRFYKFCRWVNEEFNNLEGRSINIIGLRAEESPDRRMVLFGEDSELFWLRRKTKLHKVYPIIDWSYKDVWKYIIDNGYKYNKVYDKMYALGKDLRYMRVSCLIHEKAFKCLADLQELEPDTYNKLENRLQGVHCGAMYAKEQMMYSIKKLPPNFNTWYDYKNSLLKTINRELARIFEYQWSRFGDTRDEQANKYMVKRILLCDWEGNMTWSRDNEFNYTPEQLKEKHAIKKSDAIIQKWFNL